jgi:hypothetical protein
MIAWHPHQVNEAIVLGNLRLSSGLDDDQSFSSGSMKGTVRLLRYAPNDMRMEYDKARVDCRGLLWMASQ